MKINIRFENCSFSSHYLVEESADSVIRLEIQIENIATSQSKKVIRDGIATLIHSELSKFEWLIIGPVSIEFAWFLSVLDKQETDRIGDLDNIAKPVQDALSGPDGIMVDDSQIKSLHSCWMRKNEAIPSHLLTIRIDLNNDQTIRKKDLFFFEHKPLIYVAMNADITKKKDIIMAKMCLKALKIQRLFTNKFKTKGANADSYFVSDCDFHKTRLSGFRNHLIDENKLNQECQNIGLTFKDILSFSRINNFRD